MPAWNIDTSHSAVTFTVRHMMFSKVRGRFQKWNGKLDYDPANPAAARVEVSIDTASIDTNEEKRDGHLRSPDFFDAAQFPQMTFKSRKVDEAGKGKLRITGDLSLHGVTREVVLDVENHGTGKDPWGNQRAGFTATTQINRTDFGLKWNQALEAGGVLVSEKVDIELEIQAIPA